MRSVNAIAIVSGRNHELRGVKKATRRGRPKREATDDGRALLAAIRYADSATVNGRRLTRLEQVVLVGLVAPKARPTLVKARSPWTGRKPKPVEREAAAQLRSRGVEFSRLRYPKSAAASWPTPPAVLDAAARGGPRTPVESMLFDDIEVAVRIVELLRLDDRTLRELLERAWLDMFGGVRPPDDFVSEARIYREAARVRERRLLRSLSAARRCDE